MEKSTPKYADFFQQLPNKFYFQRNELTEDLSWKLRNTEFLAVLGKPGAGKSSLVKEELVKSLTGGKKVAGRFGTTWRIGKTYTHRNPIDNLAGAIFSQLRNRDPQFLNKIRHTLRSGSSGLVEVYQQYIAPEVAGDDGYNLLIVIDQVEDIFRYKKFEDSIGEEAGALEDVLFFNLLLNAVQEKIGIYFLLIIDIKYLDLFTKYRGLSELINENRFYIPSIGFQELDDQIPDLPLPLVQLIRRDCEQLFRQNDPFAVAKIRMGLYLLSQEFDDRTGADQPEPDLLDFYRNDLKGIGGAMNSFAESIFANLHETEQLLCERMFKAISLYNTADDGLALRKPMLGKTLFPVCTRDLQPALPLPQHGNPPTAAEATVLEYYDLDQLVKKFNTGVFRVINKITPGRWDVVDGDLSDQTIVDLADRALINNWIRMRAWIFLETRNASIYLNLVEDSLHYYKDQGTTLPAGADQESQLTPSRSKFWSTQSLETIVRQPRRLLTRLLSRRYYETEKLLAEIESRPKTGLYEEGKLESTREFWLTTNPNAAWASQYYPLQLQSIKAERPPEDAEKIERVARQFPSSLQMAYSFLRSSVEQSIELSNLKKALQEARLRFFKNLNILIGIVLVIAVAFAIWAFIEKNAANRMRTHLELHNFINVLSQTQIIFDNPRDPTKKDNITFNQLKDTIILDRKVKDNADVLDLLEKYRFLDLPGDSLHLSAAFKTKYRALSERSIMAIWSLYEVLKTNINRKDSILSRVEEMLQIGSETQPNIYSSKEYPDSFFQYPYLYHALQEHLDTIDNKDYFLQHSSFVSTFSSNPQNEDQFAFGDVNGNIVVHYSPDVEDDKPLSLISPDKGIAVLNYSTDGERLYAGTNDGKLYRYDDLLHYFPGIPIPSPIDIFTADDRIVFIGNTHDPKLLVVATQFAVTLLAERPSGEFQAIDRYPIAGELPILRCAAAANHGDNLYFLGGKDRTLVFRLSDRRRIQLFKTFEHPGITITAIGLSDEHARTIDNEVVAAIALGSESGVVWIERLEQFLAREPAVLKAADGVDYHESAVSSLLFNHAFPQMASASLDGSIRLWNLRFMNTGFDNVRLEDKKQGVWNLCYINADQLVATENSNIKIWSTNILQLMKALKLEEAKYRNE